MPGQPATAPFSRQARAAANGHLTMATHVAGIAEKSLREEGIPALFEVGEEDRVVDVTQCVRVTPPDLDRMLEYRAHALAPLNSTPRYRNFTGASLSELARPAGMPLRTLNPGDYFASTAKRRAQYDYRV